MSVLTEYLELRSKKEKAKEYRSFNSERSIRGLSDWNDPTPVFWEEEDEDRLDELQRILEGV